MGTCLNLDFVNSVAVMLGNYWLNNVVHLSSVRSVLHETSCELRDY